MSHLPFIPLVFNTDSLVRRQHNTQYGKLNEIRNDRSYAKVATKLTRVRVAMLILIAKNLGI